MLGKIAETMSRANNIYHLHRYIEIEYRAVHSRFGSIFQVESIRTLGFIMSYMKCKCRIVFMGARAENQFPESHLYGF